MAVHTFQKGCVYHRVTQNTIKYHRAQIDGQVTLVMGYPQAGQSYLDQRQLWRRPENITWHSAQGAETAFDEQVEVAISNELMMSLVCLHFQCFPWHLKCHSLPQPQGPASHGSVDFSQETTLIFRLQSQRKCCSAQRAYSRDFIFSMPHQRKMLPSLSDFLIPSSHRNLLLHSSQVFRLRAMCCFFCAFLLQL